jgi:hypothetical protein
MIRNRKPAAWIAAVCLPFLATGCLVQPWTAERMTDKYQHKNDTRTPILPPIRDGFPEPRCEDAPSDREVLCPRRSAACPSCTRSSATTSPS